MQRTDQTGERLRGRPHGVGGQQVWPPVPDSGHQAGSGLSTQLRHSLYRDLSQNQTGESPASPSRLKQFNLRTAVLLHCRSVSACRVVKSCMQSLVFVWWRHQYLYKIHFESSFNFSDRWIPRHFDRSCCRDLIIMALGSQEMLQCWVMACCWFVFHSVALMIFFIIIMLLGNVPGNVLHIIKSGLVNWIFYLWVLM